MSAAEDEDSGPGHGTTIRDSIARERLRSHSKRLDDLSTGVGVMGKEISDVRSRQTKQETKVETLIEFHVELKRYARFAITGVFGIIGLQIIQLILKKGSP